jgi:hypothetical protein
MGLGCAKTERRVGPLTMFLEAASKVTGIFLPSQARLVGKKTRFPSVHVLSGFLRRQGQTRA